MRLYYHPESDALFLAEPGDWQLTGDGALSEDVSDKTLYRKMALLDGLDLDEVESFEQFVGIADMAVAKGGVAGAIAASMQKWARKPADLYPTPEDCTYSLLPHIAHLLPPKAKILEPACANGQMVRPLREFGYQVDGYDLRPDVEGGQGGFDFLADHGTVYDWEGNYDGVFTNPPFTCAEAFIRRALEVAPVVVMLLKAQYWNTKNRKALFRETKPYAELNLTWRPAFLAAERGNSPLMDCMWVVWVRGHTGDCTTTMIDRLVECPVNVGHMDFGGL